MRKIKRILSAALALVLSLVLVMPAFAAGNVGSITINNAQPGKTYQAYRLFDLSLSGSNYGYTLNGEWKDFFTAGAGKDMVRVDTENGNVKLEDTSAAGVQALAQAAKTYVADNTGKVTVYPSTGDAPTLTFSNLPLGYYLVTTDAGGLCALDTTDPTAEMFEKNTVPTIGKTADKTNAAYGETVSYEIPFTRGGYVWGDYVITDTMTGLDLTDGTIKIQVNQQDIAEESYTFKYTQNTPATGSHTLEVTIPAATLNKYEPGTQFVLIYEAVAKKTVSMDNIVTMEYKTSPDVNDPSEKTPPIVVKVANYEFTVKKVNENGDTLNGATFELHKSEDCTDEAMQFVLTDSTYRLATAGEVGATTDIAAGEVKIEGLAAGIYYLQEIAAPDGYNKLVKPVKVEIFENLNNTEGNQYKGQAFDNDGHRIDPTIKMNDTDVSKTGSEFILTVVNKTGDELPSTGGIGTTVFYVVGGVLVLAAVVLLVVKKRMAR